MRRSARVIQMARVSVPNSGVEALRVTTDLDRADERAFYLRPDSIWPGVGAPIEWGDHRAWYGNHVARKIGNNFDPEAPLA